MLAAAGYVHYELSNFALPGFECRHNMGYWQYRDYVGLGLGASGCLQGQRWTNVSQMDAFTAAVQEGILPTDTTESLSKRRREGEYAMLRMRLPVIGLELGSVYAALGARVTVVEMTAGLLPGVDRDLIVPLSKRLRGIFQAIHLNTRVAGIADDPGGLRVTLENVKTGEARTENFAKALVAIGRRPYADGQELEKAGITLTDRGFITVDSTGRTANPRVFAVGDVAGNPMLAHKATHEARALVARLLGRDAQRSAHVPAVVFTDPEIAWVGLTETQAAEQGVAVKVSKFPWAASGRALTLDRGDGVTKILADPATGKLLGVAITGPGAGDLISEATLALETGATAADLERVIHPHPTLAETLGEAADLHAGLCTHLFRPKPPRA